MDDKQYLYYFSYIAALENYYCDEMGIQPDWKEIARTILYDVLYSFVANGEETEDIEWEKQWKKQWKKQVETCKKLKVKPRKNLGKMLMDLLRDISAKEPKKLRDQKKKMGQEIKYMKKIIEAAQLTIKNERIDTSEKIRICDETKKEMERADERIRKIQEGEM
jgi:hypothetical protein